MKNTGKRIDLIANRKPQSQKVLFELKERLKKNNFILNDKNPDIVVSIGGDGMLLSAFHKYENQLDKVRFVGVHTGHLGFYTDYSAKDFEKIFFDMLALEPKVEQYPLLRLKAYCKDGKLIADSYSLNEITVNSHSGSTYAAKVFINGEHFENFRGDGLCISTPTGSTYYNKLFGGAVIHPQMYLYQITEIAALNNIVYRTLGNSIILSKEDELIIKPLKLDNHRISVDFRTFNYDTVSKLYITLAKDKKISFIRYNDVSFWKRVKRSFIENE